MIIFLENRSLCDPNYRYTKSLRQIASLMALCGLLRHSSTTHMQHTANSLTQYDRKNATREIDNQHEETRVQLTSDCYHAKV